jgi:hypothetical protein
MILTGLTRLTGYFFKYQMNPQISQMTQITERVVNLCALAPLRETLQARHSSAEKRQIMNVIQKFAVFLSPSHVHSVLCVWSGIFPRQGAKALRQQKTGR